MILRSTQKLAHKLKIKNLIDTEIKVLAFEEWYGQLFTVNRVQYILFTNSYSLFSIVLPGKGINNLRTFMDLTGYWLSEVLKDEGCENLIDRLVIHNLDGIDVYATNNRSILGSMTDMVIASKYLLSEYQLKPIELAKQLNKTPLSYLKYEYPVDMMKKMALS